MSTAAECRARFAAYEAEHGEPATRAHGLHHEVQFEPITEPIENRIAYIEEWKPASEHAVRFAMLWPIDEARLPAAVVKAWAAVVKARAAVIKARAAVVKARAAVVKARAAVIKARAAVIKAQAARDKAWAAYVKAQAARDKAWAALVKAQAAYGKAIAAIPHADICPIPDTCTWNGRSYL